MILAPLVRPRVIMSTINDEPASISEDGCYVALTQDHLNAQQVIDQVRSPAAGAIVLFAGMFDILTTLYQT